MAVAGRGQVVPLSRKVNSRADHLPSPHAIACWMLRCFIQAERRAEAVSATAQHVEWSFGDRSWRSGYSCRW